LALKTTPFVFINSVSIFVTKELKLKIDSAASNGGQGKLEHFMHFSWPPLEATLSIFQFFFFEKELIKTKEIAISAESYTS